MSVQCLCAPNETDGARMCATVWQLSMRASDESSSVQREAPDKPQVVFPRNCPGPLIFRKAALEFASLAIARIQPQKNPVWNEKRCVLV